MIVEVTTTTQPVEQPAQGDWEQRGRDRLPKLKEIGITRWRSCPLTIAATVVALAADVTGVVASDTG